jgi:DNA ligase-1
MKFPILYGKSTTGKIKSWKVEVIKASEEESIIRIEHGYSDGKKQEDVRSVTSGKNIGKANETTPYQQAISEAKSDFNKKRDEGYAESVDNIKEESYGFFLPMLAHKWDDHASKIKFPAVLEPKYDGFRCLAKKEDGIIYLWSRKGKALDIPTEIKEELSKILAEGESADGELYRHGWGFQRIASAIKKRNADTPGLHYYIYDAPVLNKSFQERFLNRWSGVPTELSSDPKFVDGTSRIVLCPNKVVNSAEEVMEGQAQAIEAGYEGAMVRNLASEYMFKNRSSSLLKVKSFEDAEFEIIGGKEGQGREAGMVVFKCKTSDGTEFDVRPRGTQEERSLMWQNLNSYIGKPLTVKYQGLTDDGRPRFPVGLHIRPDWD